MSWDYRQADLTAEDRALCDYAVKLTLIPAQVDAVDIERLKKHGFDDEKITIAAQVVGYFNYINRIAEGLGVEPQAWMTTDREQWLADKGKEYLQTLGEVDN